MRAPGFWHEPAGIMAAALSPLGALYAAGTARRLRKGPRESVGVPVICIGNINAGGTGKTPTAIAVAQRLAARGVAVHAVTRGYGGEINGPVQVDERSHDAKQVGDEALLLAAFLPTWVSADRVAGAKAAVAAGAECLILDDGFQNPGLAYDLSVVVVDAWRGFGNGKVIPAGPLREPVDVGLTRADMVVSIGPEAAQTRFAATWGAWVKVPQLTGALEPLATGMSLDGVPVLAFAGIGHPEKFFQTLRGLGADLHATHALADHQPLSDTLMTRLLREAWQRGAQVVTTEKDAVRLSPEFRSRVMTVPVRLQMDDWAPLDAGLDRVLARK
ncbi:tetraacyldisaccharide 4'-kinase [Gymnodinialimonas sp. 57CJ19]|uniref:tetraacyldisaccharide 4'-kinase n=1 Tax=Gymnodinialimonas sp. 57CJ19 TaxID=3138498 RepID=UPI003134528A